MPHDAAHDPGHDAGLGVPAGLVLYTRARCGVCRRAEEQIRRELARVRPSRRVPLTLVDVDAAGLDDRYGVRVPVLLLDGVELSELELAAGVVRAALRDRARGRRRGRLGRRG
jgi:hypothetical protein